MESYPYGFNGQEEDKWNGDHGAYGDFGERMYDERLGRFMTTDPLEEEFPWQSPYIGMDDSPIYLMDPDGESTVSPSDGDGGGKKSKEGPPAKSGWESDVNVKRDERGNIEPGQEEWHMRHAPKNYKEDVNAKVDIPKKDHPNPTIDMPKPEPTEHNPDYYKKRKFADHNFTMKWGYAFYLGGRGFTFIEWSIGNPDYTMIPFVKRQYPIGKGSFRTTGGWKHKVIHRRKRWNGTHGGRDKRVPKLRMHYFGFFIFQDSHQKNMYLSGGKPGEGAK